jgi:hypothetical protein
MPEAAEPEAATPRTKTSLGAGVVRPVLYIDWASRLRRVYLEDVLAGPLAEGAAS